MNKEMAEVEKAMVMMGLISTVLGVYIAYLQLKKLRLQYKD